MFPCFFFLNLFFVILFCQLLCFPFIVIPLSTCYVSLNRFVVVFFFFFFSFNYFFALPLNESIWLKHEEGIFLVEKVYK